MTNDEYIDSYFLAGWFTELSERSCFSGVFEAEPFEAKTYE